jgi:DNA (cytosine-5)-methyltransferase 1
MVVEKEHVFVDLYCGAGGTTTGAQQAAKALGIKLKCVAVNHNTFAISTHSVNHPDTEHHCQDVQDVDPVETVPGRYVRFLWASLECTHHSNARGGKPMNDQSRSSAWDLLRWCAALDIDTVMIENVREFLDWGPLIDADCPVVKLQNRPMPEWKGEFFHSFIEQMKMLGYKVEWKILNAADYGDPTSRKRLFVQCQKRKAIVWPARTHGTEDCPHRTAREIIDFSQKGKSIFRRKKPLAANTMRRIMAGMEKFSSEAFKPWLVVLRNHMDSRSVDLPLPALCASGQHFGVAHPFLVQYFGGKDAVSIDQPVPTICANYEHYALCEPFIVGAGGPAGSAEPQSVGQPLGTVMTENHRALCEPFIMNISHQGKGAQDSGHLYAVDQPLPTVITEQEFALCDPYIIGMEHTSSDHPCRCKTLDEPLQTVTGKGMFALCEPFLVPNFGEREGQEPRTHSVDAPLPAVTGHGAGALVQPYLVEYHGGDDGDKRTRSLDEPLPTQDCSNRFGLAEPFITPYYGHSTAVSIDEPLDTVTSRDTFGLVEPFITPYRGQSKAVSIDDPLGTVTSMNTFGLCEPQIQQKEGVYYLDIRFRMLSAPELAAAMSFPKDYQFMGGRERTVKQIGNAVPVSLAMNLCMAVLQDEASFHADPVGD